jgi:hypothetical protein
MHNVDEFLMAGYQRFMQSMIDSQKPVKIEEPLMKQISGRTVRRYFKPEIKQLREIARTLEKQFGELASTNLERLRDDPSLIKKLTLGELLEFEDSERQREFAQQIQYSIEDFAQVAEIAILEASDMYRVKSQTPIIGGFVRRGVAKQTEYVNALFGVEEFPSTGEAIQYIREQKTRLEALLPNMTNVEGVERTPQKVTAQSYERDIGCPIRVERSKRLEEGILSLENPPFEDISADKRTRREQSTRDDYFLGSRYNGWGVRAMGKFAGFMKALFSGRYE